MDGDQPRFIWAYPGLYVAQSIRQQFGGGRWQIMKNQIFRLLIGATMVFFSFSYSSDNAKAQEIALNLLSEWCQSSDIDLNTLCTIYISGILEGVVVGQILEVRGGMQDTCVPIDKLNNSEMHIYLRKFLSENSELFNNPVVAVLATSLAMEFPCDQRPDQGGWLPPVGDP